MTEGRFADFLRLGTADIENNQTNRPADGGIGPKAVTQGVMTAVDPDLATDRAVDNRQRRGREGRDVDRVQGKLLFTYGFDRSHNHRKKLAWQPAMTALMATFSTLAGP